MRDIDTSLTSSPILQLSSQAYRQIEGVLLGWSSDRPEALLLCEAHLHNAKSSIPPAFLLYLSPEFKALIQVSPEFQLSFDLDTLRDFSQTLSQQNELPQNLQAQLEQKLAEPWVENDPEQHSQFAVTLLQPLPEPRSIRSAIAKLSNPPAAPLPIDLEARPQELIAELQAAWEAVRVAKRAKEEFMALISHELRTPLTCVIGMSATLLRWSLGPLSDRQRDCLQTINDSGNHLMQIIDSILDLSQASLGKTALNIQPVSLKNLVQYCVQLFQEVAETRSINLRSSSSLNAPEDDIFFGDAQRLRQILINLLDNAIKFTEANGTVRMRMSREGAVLKWEIEDTGIGISQVDRDRLFQEFQQLEDSHRRRFGGAGLGLALTKQLVELHGGKIEIDSNPGQGSRFTVWLTEQQAPIQTVKPTKIQGEVVLLEEDEQSATLICELLTAAGYKVFWLVDSSTALEQIELLQPVALIVNLQFQGNSGEELVHTVSQMKMAHPPQIIGLLPRTMQDQAAFKPPASAAQVHAYVFTPFHPAELVSLLNPKPNGFPA